VVAEEEILVPLRGVKDLLVDQVVVIQMAPLQVLELIIMDHPREVSLLL
tara:strand:+ start:235 stop:381 length:147 start_codon:yes stop_codon:yes gene_type:complete